MKGEYMQSQQSFSQDRATQLLRILITSTNPNISNDQAQVTANTIASTFNVTPRISGVSKKKSKNKPHKNTKTGQYFSLVEKNNTENNPISISVNTDPSSSGCNAQFSSGYITLNVTRKQAKALRYALHTFLQQTQQQGVSGHDSSWQEKVNQSHVTKSASAVAA